MVEPHPVSDADSFLTHIPMNPYPFLNLSSPTCEMVVRTSSKECLFICVTEIFVWPDDNEVGNRTWDFILRLVLVLLSLLTEYISNSTKTHSFPKVFVKICQSFKEPVTLNCTKAFLCTLKIRAKYYRRKTNLKTHERWRIYFRRAMFVPSLLQFANHAQVE